MRERMLLLLIFDVFPVLRVLRVGVTEVRYLAFINLKNKNSRKKV